MESLWDRGTKVCSNGPGHMTNMTAVPYMLKILKNFYSGTKRPITPKLGMQHRVLEHYNVYSNNDTGLTLTYFTARSNLLSFAFVWEKLKQWIFLKLLSAMI